MTTAVIVLSEVRGAIVIINPRCACAARVTVLGLSVLSVCPSVCVCVSTLILALQAILRLNQRLQRNTRSKFNVAILLKRPSSRAAPSWA